MNMFWSGSSLFSVEPASGMARGIGRDGIKLDNVLPFSMNRFEVVTN
jgi:hypothetical protein